MLFRSRFLDKKDIVKLSIQKFGEHSRITTNRHAWRELAPYIPYVKHCPMSKKQAKYFNKIVSLSGASSVKMTNAQSPDRRALKLLSDGDVVGAASIYAESGSMLQRRIRMLLSRLHFLRLEKAIAPHSRTLAWKIPWTEEPGELQSMGSLTVGHD